MPECVCVNNVKDADNEKDADDEKDVVGEKDVVNENVAIEKDVKNFPGRGWLWSSTDGVPQLWVMGFLPRSTSLQMPGYGI